VRPRGAGAVAALLLLLAASPAPGRELDGAWSVAGGAGLGEPAPALSVLHGSGRLTAWGLDAGADPYAAWAFDDGDALYADPPLPDSVLEKPSRSTQKTFLAGPRFRRYLRPLTELAAFVDLRVSATYSSIESEGEDFHRERRRWGCELGSGLGFEWLPGGSPVTLAAQTDVFSVRLERDQKRFDDPSGSTVLSDDVLSFIVQFQPRFYLRVWF
jgi:hypothetical protein